MEVPSMRELTLDGLATRENVTQTVLIDPFEVENESMERLVNKRGLPNEIRPTTKSFNERSSSHIIESASH